MDELNIYKNKLKNIRELYPELKKHNDVWVLGIYQKICENQIINEFITKTIDIQKTYNTLESRFKNEFNESSIEDDESLLVTFIKGQFGNIIKINKFLDSFGWFPAVISYKEGYKKFNEENLKQLINNGVNYLLIKYEAKFDTEVFPKDKFLYHLVPDILYKKIQLSGLTPKTKSKISTHPERIYLLYPGDNDDYENISIRLWESLDSKTKELVEYYYLLQIDISKLENIKFYKDPNFYMGNGGVWIYQNIPPLYIKNTNKFLVNPKV